MRVKHLLLKKSPVTDLSQRLQEQGSNDQTIYSVSNRLGGKEEKNSNQWNHNSIVNYTDSQLYWLVKTR